MILDLEIAFKNEHGVKFKWICGNSFLAMKNDTIEYVQIDITDQQITAITSDINIRLIALLSKTLFAG
jgi:hypothetical protein